MTFRDRALARMSDTRLRELHYAAARELAELIRSIDRASPTGRANVWTVWNHPDYKRLLDAANRTYPEMRARGLL